MYLKNIIKKTNRLEEIAFALDALGTELEQLGNQIDADVCFDTADRLSGEAQFIWDNRGMEMPLGEIELHENVVQLFGRTWP